MHEQLEKRPALRALEKVVSEEGFKTVVTLRLAPVLPIPLGAYNYGAYHGWRGILTRKTEAAVIG